MKKTEEEKWESVKYRMEEEGFDYCFERYSSWTEIHDEEFHKLRKIYLESKHVLEDYINSKVS